MGSRQLSTICESIEAALINTKSEANEIINTNIADFCMDL